LYWHAAALRQAWHLADNVFLVAWYLKEHRNNFKMLFYDRGLRQQAFPNCLNYHNFFQAQGCKAPGKSPTSQQFGFPLVD